MAHACLCAALLSGCGAYDARDVVRDPDGHSLALQRLSRAVTDLDAVTDPQHVRARGRAWALGCRVDSGDVFEPSAGRAWMLTGPARAGLDPESERADPLRATPAARRAAARIAEQLLARGWTGDARVRREGTRTAFHTTLRRRLAEHRLDLSLSVFGDQINADVSTSPRDVCEQSTS